MEKMRRGKEVGRILDVGGGGEGNSGEKKDS